MIKVKHPKAHCNKSQEATIQQLPEAERRFHELFFSYANATYRYHQAAREHEPTHQDYEGWLKNISRGMAAVGFEQCRINISFTRYVQEKYNVGLEAYVLELMGEDEYLEFKSIIQ